MSKLGHKLQDEELAELLIAAGFDTPRKIRDAKDADLKAIKGVGPGRLTKIRARLPKDKK